MIELVRCVQVKREDDVIRWEEWEAYSGVRGGGEAFRRERKCVRHGVSGN